MGPILDAAAAADGATGKRGTRFWLIALLIAWIALSWPLATGQSTFFARDVFATHLPAKAFGTAELAAGRIPAIMPSVGLGQPFRGDPNLLPLYPGNLLFLVLPFWSAFNLHFALHWLLAFFAMRALASTLGQSPSAALLAGLTWAGSGYVLSALTMMNLLTTIAWWPWAMAGVARDDRCGLAGGSLAVGLSLLGGEPVTAGLGLVPLLLVARERHEWRRALSRCSLVVAGGLVVALPQLVATARLASFTARTAFGASAAEAAGFALHGARLLELFVPLPFGWPGRAGAIGMVNFSVTPFEPLIFSLHLGVIALALAVVAMRPHWRWGLLAVSGLLLAWLGGQAGELVVWASRGLFRYPEKLLFWFSLAMALMAGWGLDRLRACAERFRPLAVAAAAVCATAALGLLLAREALPGAVPPLHLLLIVGSLGVAAVLFLLAAVGAARGWHAGFVGLQLVALAPLAPLWLTDSTQPYRERPPWRELVPTPAAIARLHLPGEQAEPAGPPSRSAAAAARLAATRLDLGPAFLSGLSYPLAPTPDGLGSPLMTLLELYLRSMSWPERIAWLRLLGVDALVENAANDVPLPCLAENEVGGERVRLRAVAAPAPRAFWPERLLLATSDAEAAKAVGGLATPAAAAIVAQPLAHAPGGVVTVVEERADRLELAVASSGGLVVVRRAFHPLYRARDESGRELPIVPVDVVLVGIVVPPGSHRVIVDVASRPEASAGALAVLFGVALAFAAWRN